MTAVNNKPNRWANVLKIAITVLSALAAALGIQACC